MIETKIVTKKKNYISPDFEEILIDSSITLIMQSPGGDPDPGSSSGDPGDDEW